MGSRAMRRRAARRGLASPGDFLSEVARLGGSPVVVVCLLEDGPGVSASLHGAFAESSAGDPDFSVLRGWIVGGLEDMIVRLRGYGVTGPAGPPA